MTVSIKVFVITFIDKNIYNYNECVIGLYNSSSYLPTPVKIIRTYCGGMKFITSYSL